MKASRTTETNGSNKTFKTLKEDITMKKTLLTAMTLLIAILSIFSSVSNAAITALNSQLYTVKPIPITSIYLYKYNLDVLSNYSINTSCVNNEYYVQTTVQVKNIGGNYGIQANSNVEVDMWVQYYAGEPLWHDTKILTFPLMGQSVYATSSNWKVLRGTYQAGFPRIVATAYPLNTLFPDYYMNNNIITIPLDVNAIHSCRP